MGLFTKDIKTMDDLFLHVLQDIYYAEKQILKALPDMIEKATNRELTAAFKSHLGETEKQVQPPGAGVRAARQEPEGHDLPGDRRHHQGGQRDRRRSRRQGGAGCGPDRRRAGGRALRDHPLRHADRLGARSSARSAVGKLLTTTLNEEKAADKKLTAIAEKKVNLKAAG